MVARVTATASPTLLNEFVASYTTDHITTSLIGPWQRPPNFPAVGIYDNGFGGKVPGISLTGGQYNFAEDPGYVPNGPLNSNPTFTFRDNVTKIIGAHNLQFGIYTVLAHKNEIPQPSYGVNGLLQFSNSSSITTGNAFADCFWETSVPSPRSKRRSRCTSNTTSSSHSFRMIGTRHRA